MASHDVESFNVYRDCGKLNTDYQGSKGQGATMMRDEMTLYRNGGPILLGPTFSGYKRVMVIYNVFKVPN